jgi:hypothetical protein
VAWGFDFCHTGLWARPRPGARPGGALVMPRKIWSGPVLPPPKFPGVAMESCLPMAFPMGTALGPAPAGRWGWARFYLFDRVLKTSPPKRRAQRRRLQRGPMRHGARGGSGRRCAPKERGNYALKCSCMHLAMRVSKQSAIESSAVQGSAT